MTTSTAAEAGWTPTGVTRRSGRDLAMTTSTAAEAGWTPTGVTWRRGRVTSR